MLCPLQAVIFFNIVFFKPPSYDNYDYPGWAHFLGWLIAIFPMVLIGGGFLNLYCKSGGYEVCKQLNTEYIVRVE